jgi:hypothetical protein
MGNTGYCTFALRDSDTGEDLEGWIMLVNYTDSNQRYALDEKGFSNPVKTGEVVHIAQPVFAYIYGVQLKSGILRRFLPTTISPMCSIDTNKPRLNTFNVYFYTDPAAVSVDIIRLNGENGNFNEKNFKYLESYSFTLKIAVDTWKEYSVYGHSCFVPNYRLPATSEKLGISWCGLWLVFEGAQITEATVEDQDEAEFFYMTEDDRSILLLNEVDGPESKQDIMVKLSGNPTDIYLFQGFYEEIDNTRVDL